MTHRSWSNFEPHCKLIQSYKGGKEACAADQCNLAREGTRFHDEQLTFCWAGMCNQATPVTVDGEIRAVLLYGEMQVEGEVYREKALELHTQAVRRLDLNELRQANYENSC